MTTPVIATLTIHLHNGETKEVILHEGDSIKLGRDASNDLAISDPGLSRIHATMTASANGVVLADMGSTNGTFVNGEQISSLMNLSSSDVINIGATKITIEVVAEKTAEALSSSFGDRAMTAQLKPIPIAVLITTIDNYTGMLKECPSENTSNTLLEWMHVVTATVEEYQGKIDKSIGGSIVAIWQEGSEKQLAVKAAHAALQLKSAAESFAKRVNWKWQDNFPWKCTQVISSGLGLSGVVGASTEDPSKGFTLLGDPVNTAFRLEEVVSKLGEDLIIAEQTAKLLSENFVLAKIIKVKIPGRDVGIETYTIKS